MLRRIKQRNPATKVIVTGCMAEVSPEKLSLEEVDAVVGTGEQEKVLAAIFSENDSVVLPPTSPQSRTEAKSRKSISLSRPLSEELTGPGQRLGELKSRSRYHLRVQEGCENSCTFCIIPFSRGGLSSRRPRLVLEDLSRLSELGYKEVVLSGTHLGGYGEDFGGSLLELLQLIDKHSDIHRIRLSSIDPNDLSREIVDLLAESSKFCEHFHLCLQAFSDDILKLMNRRYCMDEVFELLSYITSRIPACSIGSDIIVGFPGETENHVRSASELLRQLALAYLHVFPYSERENTAAVNLSSVVEPQERKRRSAFFRGLDKELRGNFSRSFIGKILEVIVERKDESFLFGTTREYLPVKIGIDKILKLKCKSYSSGQVLRVRAVEFQESDGKVLCELSVAN